jgi:hypothetical protein
MKHLFRRFNRPKAPKAKPRPLVPIIGGFYASARQEGGYSLYRMLYFDEDSVHISIYSNVYGEIPPRINREELSFSAMVVKQDEQGKFYTEPYRSSGGGQNLAGVFAGFSEADTYGIMHLPLARAGFLEDDLVFIEQQPLTDEDLFGLDSYLEGAAGLGEEERAGFLEALKAISREG